LLLPECLQADGSAWATVVCRSVRGMGANAAGVGLPPLGAAGEAVRCVPM